MDFNLNSFSSNLMLIALVLVSLCCLYLLYSNFTKVREIEELKGRVEDLKKIFLNQQIHNDETFSKINTALFQTLTNGQFSVQSSEQTTGQMQSASVDIKLDNSSYSIGPMDKLNVNNDIAEEVSVELRQSVLPPTKIINIDTENIDNLEGDKMTNNIIINKEGYISYNVSNKSVKTTTENKYNNDNKEINIDLHDLDNLDDINEAEANIDTDMNMEELDLDDNCEEINVDKLVSDTIESNLFDKESKEQINKDNLFNIDTVNIINAEIFDDLEDTLSIATAPIDETNDIINHNSNFNLDDIQDIDDIDNNDILEPSDIKTVQPNVNVTKVEDIDLSELLNGNTNQTKEIESNQDNSESNELLKENNENIKTIEIDTPKTDYNSMPVKQLKDIAKSHGLKTTGTKQELIQLLLAFDAK
jgi:hypothetical protein